MSAAARFMFLPRLPMRCATSEAGVTGTCFACGSKAGQLCRAPPAERIRVTRERIRAEREARA